MALGNDLERLAELHARGALSDDEFARAKARVLNEPDSPRQAAVAMVNGLRRSTHDRWLGGVCGGLAELTGLASWLWRLLFVLLSLCAGSGVLVYALLWLLLPPAPPPYGPIQSPPPPAPMPSR